MLQRIGFQKDDANVELLRLVDNVYLLAYECNPLAFLNAGSRIWVKRENGYDVYELTESWDRNKATEEAFINALCREANP